jgi:hypothetical protein
VRRVRHGFSLLYRYEVVAILPTTFKWRQTEPALYWKHVKQLAQRFSRATEDLGLIAAALKLFLREEQLRTHLTSSFSCTSMS